jgi:hypothetical protein
MRATRNNRNQTKQTHMNHNTELKLFQQPKPPNPLSEAQERTLVNLICHQIGLPAYREFKANLGIPLDVAIPRLSKAQAYALIRDILADLQQAKEAP